jgi:predicted Zn-dependent protease
LGASRSEAFRRLVEKDPGNAMVLYSLGAELFKEGRNNEAAEYLRRAVEAKPDYSAAYRSLGRVLAALGEREEASRTFRQGREVALERGDLQIVREIDVFASRLEKGGRPGRPEVGKGG